MQNAKSGAANGSINDSATSSARPKAHTDARPYPALNAEAEPLQNPNKVPASRPLSGVGYPSSVVFKIFDKPDPDADTSLSTSTDLPIIPSELLPSMNGNVLLYQQAQAPQEPHPFYPSTLTDTRQIHGMLDDGPSFSNSPFLRSSIPKRPDRFGGMESQPREDEKNQTGNLIAPEQTLLSTEIDMCRRRCGVQTVDDRNPF